MKYLHYNLMILVLLLAKVGYSQTVLSDQNFVHTITPQQPVIIEQLDQVGGDNEPADQRHIQEVVYYDGLGRPMQSVGIKQSPNSKDIVTHIEYDAFGRQTKQHLPFERDVFTGVYHAVDINQDINSYYLNTYANDFLGITDPAAVNAYSENIYEPSPLNRIQEQAAPGNAWKVGNGHEIKFDYEFNKANEVRRFKVDFSNGDTQIPIPTGGNTFYGSAQLYKNITYDENHTTGKEHSTEEFKNSDGQVLLKRTYNGSSSSGGGAEDGGDIHDTYYVYDRFDNLTFVIPPKVTTSDGVSDTELAELCYQYRYDHRNRLIEKKIPGKGWESIVYNKIDQPILTQDALLKAESAWLFTKYDAFGKVAYTGIISDGRDRKAIQNEVNTFTADLWVDHANPTTIGGVVMYYNDGGYPRVQNAEVLTINYYDDYRFLVGAPETPFVNPNTIDGVAVLNKVKSLATGSKIKVLDTNTWITTVTYYDKKARPIYVAHKNEYLNTTDVVTTKLNFTGKVKETTTTHTKDSHAAITTVDKFTYDHTGRLLTQTQTINNGNEELIVANSYDKLGQLQNKKVGGSAKGSGLQTVNYDYNIRGWLKSINNGTTTNGDLFGFKINYNTPQHGATALFNGNISETSWQTANDNVNRHYTYSYDALNRITGAISNSGNYNLSGVTYDKNGNILSLDRKGHLNDAASTFGDMDKLVYQYDHGNQLLKVTDTDHKTYGFKDGTNTGDDFVYDTNGNMTIDRNKGITNITYNHLNLPTTVAINNTDHTGNINYIYDASGTKLKKIVTEGSSLTTEYAGNYIYKNGNLEYFSTAEGYVTPEGGVYKYVYQYKDHLGNVRLSYSDADNNGTIVQSEIVQEKNYYPFGLTHKGYNANVSSLGNSTAQKFQYNGKELNDELGLDWYDYGARNYDVSLGRWMNIDPLAEMSYNLTPYRFAGNNPILFKDPNGLWEFAFDEESGTLSLNRQEGDTYDSFLEQSGLSVGQAKKLFGVSKKELKGKLNEGGGDSFAVSEFSSKSKIGNMLQGMEEALTKGNLALENSKPGDDPINNCFNCSINLSTDGRVDSKKLNIADISDATSMFKSLSTGWGFDNALANGYRNVSKPKTGDVIRYSVGNGSNADHGSIFLLQNKGGVQVFSKNGVTNANPYSIMMENTMVKTYGYGKAIGRQNYSAEQTNAEGKTETIIKSDSSQYYRKN